MKQIVGILFLLFTLKLIATGQSRILTGTLTSKPNSSMTILPNIVQTKSPEMQKDDSALFNPRYVPPPPVDSSNYNSGNANSSSGQNQNTETDYQYKTQNSQPVLDRGNTLTPSINFKNKKTSTPSYNNPTTQVNSTPTEDTYQYKTPNAQPLVDYGVKKIVHYPVRTKKVNGQYAAPKQVGTLPASEMVTDPTELAATENYGNVPVKKSYNKWAPKTKTWTKPAVNNSAVAKKPVYKWVNPQQANGVSSIQKQPTYTTPVVSAPQQGGLTPTIKVKTRPNNPVINSGATVVNQSQQTATTTYSPPTDYKINLTTDGKFTVNFFNNGSSINVTQFGRISGVTSPTTNNTTSQYDYRGMLQSVGTLPLQYTYEGRLQSVGNTQIGYNYNGNIESIGGMPFSYNYNGTIDKIGNTKVLYDANNNVSSTSNNNPAISIKTN